MSGLCGWFEPSAQGRKECPDATALGDVARSADDALSRTARAPGGAVGVAGRETEVHVFESQDCAAVIWGSVGFSDASLAAEAQRDGAAAALCRGFAADREAVFSKMSGTFAAAILDGREQQAILAIDRMGVRPLSYCVASGRLVFGTSLDAVRLLSPEPLRLRAQGIYDYLYFHMVPAPFTVYEGTRRLLPGEYVRFRNGTTESGRYWVMRYEEGTRRAFGEDKAEFLSLLRAAVRRSCAGAGTVGAFLSGGTDSSTIAGMLGEVSGEPARTYSIGFEAEGFDESHYARIAAKHFGTRHHEYFVTPDDVIAAIPMIAAAHDQPFGNSSAVPAYYCAKLARNDGVDLLLGGDGGDELFGGNERYAKQYVYSLYSDLPAFVRERFIEPIVYAVPFENGILGKAQRYVRNASIPMPARYDNYNLLERLGPESVFTPEFLETVDRGFPAAQMAATYQSAEARSLVNRMLAFDLRYTLADNDIPKVCRSCDLAGVGVAFPMLDDDLVAFSARLAPDLKLKRTKLRYFFKEALRGFLPDEIITKTKHGFGLPFGTWMRDYRPLRQLVEDTLASLRRREFIRSEFIEDLMGKRIAEHADYFGTMAWLLMMLELWLQRNAART